MSTSLKNDALENDKAESQTEHLEYYSDYLKKSEINANELNDLIITQLDKSYAVEVSRLEPLIYPVGWSEALVFAEFDKKISFRPSIFFNDILLAYSFNYVIEDELHILNLSVRPEVQGRGFGKLLLSIILEDARKRMLRHIFLEVRKLNTKAISLYSKAGFVRAGIRKAYYSDNGEDAILMELNLQ